MRTAFFTGAGVSKAIGYPLTRELLPRVLVGIKDGSLFSGTNDRAHEARDRKALKRYLAGLLPGMKKTNQRELPLITDLFSLVEHSIVSEEALPIGSENELRQCRDLLKGAITDILLGDYEAAYSDADLAQWRLLRKLADWFDAHGKEIALVTTNYDIGLDAEVYERKGPDEVMSTVDLGFDFRHFGDNEQRTRPRHPDPRVYKLHGSLDLLRCRACGHVYFNSYGSIAWRAFKTRLDDNNTCDCGDALRLELHIVPPSFVREVKDANILSVWRSALEWMRNSDHWIIAGYSLPSEDLAIRSLLMRAYAGAKKKPRITVVQPNSDSKARYRLLFPDHYYVATGIKGFLAGDKGSRK